MTSVAASRGQSLLEIRVFRNTRGLLDHPLNMAMLDSSGVPVLRRRDAGNPRAIERVFRNSGQLWHRIETFSKCEQFSTPVFRNSLVVMTRPSRVPGFRAHGLSPSRFAQRRGCDS